MENPQFEHVFPIENLDGVTQLYPIIISQWSGWCSDIQGELMMKPFLRPSGRSTRRRIGESIPGQGWSFRPSERKLDGWTLENWRRRKPEIQEFKKKQKLPLCFFLRFLSSNHATKFSLSQSYDFIECLEGRKRTVSGRDWFLNRLCKTGEPKLREVFLFLDGNQPNQILLHMLDYE